MWRWFEVILVILKVKNLELVHVECCNKKGVINKYTVSWAIPYTGIYPNLYARMYIKDIITPKIVDILDRIFDQYFLVYDSRSIIYMYNTHTTKVP